MILVYKLILDDVVADTITVSTREIDKPGDYATEYWREEIKKGARVYLLVGGQG